MPFPGSSNSKTHSLQWEIIRQRRKRGEALRNGDFAEKTEFPGRSQGAGEMLGRECEVAQEAPMAKQGEKEDRRDGNVLQVSLWMPFNLLLILMGLEGRFPLTFGFGI